MPFPFGQDIRYQFFPLIGSDNATNIPSDNPRIFYFTDSNKPTRDAAQNGTGAVNSATPITSWTAIENQNGFVFTIPAIVDPDPDSETGQRIYWLGINFKLKTGVGEPYQTVVRALELERVTGHHAQFLVTAQDIIQFFPAVESYYTASQISAIFWLVKEEIISYLTDKGFHWSLVWDPERLRVAATFKVLMRLMEGERRLPGDNWDKNHAEYKESYKNVITAVKLKYDSQRTNEPTEIKKTGGYAWISR